MSEEKAPIQAILALRAQGLHEQAEALERRFNVSVSALDAALSHFVTQDSSMIRMKEHVALLSQVDDCVLIQGETGTGKELIAKALHGSRKGNFVAINCAGMPENLIESELFGYSAGAFTDAKKDTPGLIDCADKGTLFLDEVGDLGLALQAKLLRAIQERTIRRVGGKTDMKFDCRIIAATHFNLDKQVTDKLFRRDLYARISTFVVEISPLRTRIEDVPLLIEKYNSKSREFPIASMLIEKWKSLPLSLNVRDVIQIIRRWEVLGILPKELI